MFPGYFSAPFFQDGIIAQAANDVAQVQGIPYFSSAGNQGDDSWQGSFTRSGNKDDFGCEFHDFGGTTRQKITYAGEQGRIIFQWDDPFHSVSGFTPNRRHIIAHLYRGDTNEEFYTSPVVPEPDPVIDLIIRNEIFPQQEGVYLGLSVCEPAKAGQVFMKWIAFSLGVRSIQFDTKSSTSYGHRNVEFVAGVGSAFFRKTPAFGTNPPEAEVFSSLGGTPIFFERDGTRKSEALVLNQPRFVGTDGNLNSFFGDFLFHEPNEKGFYFYGELWIYYSYNLESPLLCLLYNPS